MAKVKGKRKKVKVGSIEPWLMPPASARRRKVTGKVGARDTWPMLPASAARFDFRGVSRPREAGIQAGMRGEREPQGLSLRSLRLVQVLE
jgi:hypothetical protein